MDLKRPNLYLDVDGVLLGKHDPDSPEVVMAKHAEEFLGICLDKFQVYWLTTHCKEGDASRVLRVLAPYSTDRMMHFFKQVKPTAWNAWKTEAIDFESDFYWVDDQPMAQEVEHLKDHGAFGRLIQINTRKNPDDLLKAIELVGRPLGQQGRTFVIGDMHGAHAALLQCLERSGFNRKNDRLIVLGDICDGYPEVNRCIDELMTLEHLDFVIGNHDLWALGWALWNEMPEDWLGQGGENTILSYNGGPMPEEHSAFLKRGKKYIELENRLFVHGGFDPDEPIKDQKAAVLTWDRTLINQAFDLAQKGHDEPIGTYVEIFIGHTPTTYFGTDQPQKFCNVWAIDTGCGWNGRLTIMDIDTNEYWQSDPTQLLYPGVKARRG